MRTRLSLFALLAFSAAPALAQPGMQLPNFRPYDQTGINTFETRKDTALTDGMKLRWGAAFSQTFQSLDHENDTAADDLIKIGSGFNLAQANLMMDAQLAKGIRVNLTSYLSSRHHNETWVKGGFVQIDELPFFNSPAIDRIMDHVTIKMGHMEVNYGDAHFRRTDGGEAMYNPFIDNNIMDSFTTEVGGELYVHQGPVMAMVGVTGGEIQAGITVPTENGVANPDARKPSFVGKLAFDQQVTPDMRARLAASVYTTSSSVRNTLFGGDRTGSNYWLVMEPTSATLTGNAFSGRVNPGLTDQLTAIQVNPFLKWRGLEFFGTYERAEGRQPIETVRRTWTQLAGDVVYRFLPHEQAFVGARYNTVTGNLAGAPNATGTANAGLITTLGNEVTINRMEVGAGWAPIPQLLLKGSYVNQTYDGYPTASILSGGQFNGVVIQAVLAF
ncbi:MAG: hypothetical protein IAE99_08600 [Rhodothermales bacterium]|nr:hypothetical protein [Rhodothermales bacterium]